MPLSNRLQAVELILDSFTQKHPEFPMLQKALWQVRAVQKKVNGQRMVKELSLLHHMHKASYDGPSQKNWRKRKKELALQHESQMRLG